MNMTRFWKRGSNSEITQITTERCCRDLFTFSKYILLLTRTRVFRHDFATFTLKANSQASSWSGELCSFTGYNWVNPSKKKNTTITQSWGICLCSWSLNRLKTHHCIFECFPIHLMSPLIMGCSNLTEKLTTSCLIPTNHEDMNPLELSLSPLYFQDGVPPSLGHAVVMLPTTPPLLHSWCMQSILELVVFTCTVGYSCIRDWLKG